MNNLLKLGKKVFTVGVASTTIFWSLGVAALVPAVASAATVNTAACSTIVAGDFIKGTGAAVWAVNADKSMSYFPDGDTFKSWTVDASYKSIKLVDAACMGTFPQVGIIATRPGSYLLKDDATNKLYTVLADGKLASITTDVAKALYGTTYDLAPAKGGRTIKVSTPDMMNYNKSMSATAITEASATEGSLVSNGGKYYVVGANKGLREVSATGLTANNLQKKLAYALTSTAGYVMGTAVDAAEATLMDATFGMKSTGTVLVPSAGGALTVSLAANTPAGINLPSNTAFNEILKFNLSAGSLGAVVNGLTLQKNGYTSNQSVSGIDVVDANGVRHGNVASSINSDNQVVLLFGSNPVSVPANSSVTLTVRVNLSSAGNSGTIKLGVAKLDTTSVLSGTLPLYGNEFTLVSGSNALASSTISALTISGGSGAQLNADADNEQEITKFRISETGNNEDLLLSKLTLFNYGNAADTDYKDVQLVAVDGTVLATAQPMAQQVTFDLAAAPFRITKGQYKDLTVRAKIVSGTTKSLQLVIYNDYDVVLKGGTTGASVLATDGQGDGGAATFPLGDNGNWNKVTIQSGTLNFNKDSSSPSNATTPGASNVVLAKYYVKAVGEDMELRKVNFGLLQTNYALTGNVYVKVDGASVWSGSASSFNANGTAIGATALNTYPTLKAGVTSYITVEGNVNSLATSSASYLVKQLDLTEVKKLISNTIGDPAVSPRDANTIQVTSAALTAKTLSLPVAQTVVAGVSNFEVARFELNASNSGEDVRVASIVVGDTLSTGSAYTDVTNLTLYQLNSDGTLTQLTTSNNTSVNGNSNTFNLNNPLYVAQNTIATLVLKADMVANTNSESHTFALSTVNATGKVNGGTVTVSPAGNGQAMGLTGSGTLVASLVSGSNGAPSTNQLVNVGTKDGTYFAFRLSAQNESAKVRTLKLTASGSALRSNSVKNLRLYRNAETTPFASANEMTCSSNTCSYSWTASDNVLADAVQPGAPVTISVKADIGDAGQAALGDNFAFSIASSTTDIIAVGGQTGASETVTGAPTASGATSIVPFNVSIAGVTPTAGSSFTQTVAAGTTVGRFLITNNGNAPVTVSNVTLADNGSHTQTSTTYKMWVSSESGQDYTNTAVVTTATNTVAFGALNVPFTLNGGASRYLTVQIVAAGGMTTGDSWNLAVSSLGSVSYGAAETDLGYDANVSGGALSNSVAGTYYAAGTPSLGTIVKQ